ncbi:MAG: hypothetical protein K9M45_10005 [Kiritimatiellales bacterium]|nr:hypothetical protein [Kiritimatiellales bacterium]
MMKKSIMSVVLLSALTQASFTEDSVRVDIDVSSKKGQKTILSTNRSTVKKHTLECFVTVKKASPAPYAGPLKAELYIIAVQMHSDYYGIKDIIKSEFAFTSENKNQHSFSSGPIMMGQSSGDVKAGGKYEGFLVVVLDQSDRVVDVNGSRTSFEREADKIRGFDKLTLFDDKFRVQGKSDPANSLLKSMLEN